MIDNLTYDSFYLLIPCAVLLVGWLLDVAFGDPERLPHPIVYFGKWISFGEHRLNKGGMRMAKGAVFAVVSVAMVYGLSFCVLRWLNETTVCDGWLQWLGLALQAVLVFFCLAGHTLRKEVREVFVAVDRSIEDGRRQVARIVGRDTSELDTQEIRTAALETLAENLSDGVIAPLFWYALLGVPGMLAYKMVNTLDSMIGYHSERYKDFGCWAARIDDVANYIPARVTAGMMIVAEALGELSGRLGGVIFARPLTDGRKGNCAEGRERKDNCRERKEYSEERKEKNNEERKEKNSEERKGNCEERRGKSVWGLWTFVRKYGPQHASPNSGWPEAALAGILDCRFGGPHNYFGEYFYKPYIGSNPRLLTTDDMTKSIRVCLTAECLSIILLCLGSLALLLL